MSVEPNIKNRVTGAIVLIALAVIFLPLILDGQKKKQILQSQIPEKPIKGEIIQLYVEDIAAEDVSEPVNEKKTKIKQQAAPLKNNPGNEEKTTEKVTESKPVTEVVVSKPDIIIGEPVEERRNRPNFKSSVFVIQLGSFGNKPNANKLVKTLKNAKYKAYVKTGTSNGKAIHRVFVGPLLKRQQAESKLAALNKLSGLKSIIMVYDPVKH